MPEPTSPPPLLLIDKPAGWTSHDVVAKARGILKTRAIGHAGTLDPFATGLLILGVGKGTKQLTELVGLDKTYEATLTLGATSSTFDPEGIIVPTVAVADSQARPREDGSTRGSTTTLPTIADIERILDQFRGGYDQKAPLHSAKKRAGKKLYELARAGQATEDMRPVKQVKIDELMILRYAWPELELRVQCGSGTYIRSLGDDIGRALGVGAYVSKLRRTKIGRFDVNEAQKIEEIRYSVS